MLRVQFKGQKKLNNCILFDETKIIIGKQIWVSQNIKILYFYRVIENVKLKLKFKQIQASFISKLLDILYIAYASCNPTSVLLNRSYTSNVHSIVGFVSLISCRKKNVSTSSKPGRFIQISVKFSSSKRQKKIPEKNHDIRTSIELAWNGNEFYKLISQFLCLDKQVAIVYRNVPECN